MRHLLLFLILLAAAIAPAGAQTHVTAPGGRVVSEWWYEPAEPGWGLVLTHAGTRTVVVHANFDASGRDFWQVGVGARSISRFEADLVQTRWDPVAGQVASQQVAGRVDLRYQDAESAVLVLTQGDQVSTRQLKRVISTRDASVDDYSGLWHNPAKPGFGMALLTQGPVLAVLATAYDNTGAPRWWMGYKLSRPNDPAPFTAKRFRRQCGTTGCSVQESPAGSISIQPRHEREISAQLALSVGFLDDPALQFQDHAIYANLGEPASGRERISDARPFHSEQALEDYFRLAQAAQPEIPFECLDFSPLPPGAASGPGGSVTNTQEASIDEGDILARSGDLVVHRVLGTRFTEPPIQLGEFHLTRIRADQAAAQTIRVLPQGDWQYAEQALALPAPEGEHRFALLASNRQNGFAICCPSPVTVTPKTTLSVVRVRADDSLVVEWQYTVDARPGTLRRSGDHLLLLTNSSLLQAPDPNSSATVVHRPRWRLNGQPSAPLLAASNTWLAGFQPGTLGTTVVSVHRLRIDAPQGVQHFSMLQNQANMYVSNESVYLAATRSDPLRFGIDNTITAYRAFTTVHKLRAEDLSWRGSADVRGQLQWGSRATWGLQEKNGDLRVVTALRDRTDADPATAALLTVLREDPANRKLVERVRLPNANRREPLGRPGESVYGVRLLDDRMQLVTFRQVDPLYDVDLSNPDDPRIAGELEISGYSEYLHVLPPGQLLGFGVEVDPSGATFFAPEKLKLSLFGLAQDNGPIVERQTFRFGGPYSQLPLLYEPHALAVFSPGPNQVRMSTPMQLWSEEAPWTPDPVSVLKIRYDASGAELAEVRNVPVEGPVEADAHVGLARTVLYGDQLYLFHSGAIYGDRFDSTADVLPRIDD